MSDVSLPVIIRFDTTANRGAFTPDPGIPEQLYIWLDSDDQPNSYYWDGDSWEPFASGSVVGGITELTGDVTAGPGAGSQVATISNNVVTPAMLTDDAKTFSIGITIDNAGSVITTGMKGFRRVPVDCEIIRWTLMADVAGDVEFDIFADPPASDYPPVTSIVASAPPELSSEDFADDDTLSGWSPQLDAGDVVGFEIVGTPATITRVTLQLDLVTS